MVRGAVSNTININMMFAMQCCDRNFVVGVEESGVERRQTIGIAGGEPGGGFTNNIIIWSL